MKPTTLFCIFILVGSLLGCNNEYVDSIDRGSGYNYRPGAPEIRSTATGIIDPDKGELIIVNIDAVKGSFIYKSNKDTLIASFDLEISIIDALSDKTIHRISDRKTIRSLNPSVVNSQDIISFTEEFNMEPGEYRVRVLASDRSSGEVTVRENTTTIPNKYSGKSHITEIRILGKNSASEAKDFNALTLFDIPAKFDSLKFEFQVTNNKSNEPSDIDSRLIKFESDTTIAKPMYFPDYNSSDIAYQGIDYDDYEIIQSSTRTISQTGTVNLEYNFSRLKEGNYRIETILNKGSELEVYRARDFSIKSKTYPTLSSPEELARPLVYLMEESEYNELMNITSDKKLKEAIDRFWLKNIGNSKLAKEVISLYYNRVEQANKQFSNFKEGWKTDTGMIYILFGPPWYINSSLNRMVWSYSYNSEDPEKNFLFEAPKMESKFFPFDNYLLQRNSFYFQIEYQQIQKWKSGNILRSDL